MLLVQHNTTTQTSIEREWAKKELTKFLLRFSNKYIVWSERFILFYQPYRDCFIYFDYASDSVWREHTQKTTTPSQSTIDVIESL